MRISSPWLKKILTFHLHEGLKWAYFEWLYHYTLTMVEENFEISPLWKSWKGLLRMLIDSPRLKKILESYVLKCTRMALEVCRLMLNIFCKLRKTPPLWHVYAAPPKLFFAPPASLTLKWYASRLPYELSPLNMAKEEIAEEDMTTVNTTRKSTVRENIAPVNTTLTKLRL